MRQQDQDGSQHYSWIESVFFEETSSLEIYPSPTLQGKTKLRIGESLSGIYLRVLDPQGKLAWQRTISSASGVGLIDLDLSAYPKGLYTLVVQSTGKQQIKRIIYL